MAKKKARSELRYLGEVADAVSVINGANKKNLYENLLKVAKRKTAEADTKLDNRGRRIVANTNDEFGDNVLIVDQSADALVNGLASDPQKRLFK